MSLKSPTAAKAEPTKLLLWSAREGHPGAEQFERLFQDAGLPEFTLRKVTSSMESLSQSPLLRDAHLLVLVMDARDMAAGRAALPGLRNSGTRCPVLILSDSPDESIALEWMRSGAADCFSLPLPRGELASRLARWRSPQSEVAATVEQLTLELGLREIVGQSRAIRAEVEKIQRYARCHAAVLISGETGTGKEVFARAIHYTGARTRGPFLPVNCAALPVELVENELFGHDSGAYTGARRAHRGLIEQAESGTLFLDEIDSLPLPAQAKLLRFLQEREYRPLGATASRRADVRVISAANHSLAEAVGTGRFRQDLFFRLNVLALHLPPLRERREDIPALAGHLLARHASEFGRPTARFSPEALTKLMQYDWPGNVRELENVVERALALADGEGIDAENIDLPVQPAPVTGETFKAQKLRVVLQFERRYLEEALARHGGNITHAAKAAAKNRRAFFQLLRKHNLAGQTSPSVRPGAR